MAACHSGQQVFLAHAGTHARVHFSCFALCTCICVCKFIYLIFKYNAVAGSLVYRVWHFLAGWIFGFHHNQFLEPNRTSQEWHNTSAIYKDIAAAFHTVRPCFTIVQHDAFFAFIVKCFPNQFAFYPAGIPV